jgi:prepilin-type N-terminal cleavage/methylation domain-containing protein
LRDFTANRLLERRSFALKTVKRVNCKGFTLVEVMAVIAILGIIAGIAVLNVVGTIDKSKEEVCYVNLSQLERMYESYLALEGIEHSDLVFVQSLHDFGEDICPEHGDISYVYGKVRCSVHPRDVEIEDSEEEEQDEGVPFL